MYIREIELLELGQGHRIMELTGMGQNREETNNKSLRRKPGNRVEK